jgi:exosortase/archaeosortase family protein
MGDGIEVIDGCNILGILGMYICFIVAYNGPRNYMVKFLFFGAISLFTLNVVRIFLLIIIDGYFSNFFDIFYLISSYIFFHPFILLMWYKWTQIEPN